MLLNPSSEAGYEHSTSTASGCWPGWSAETYAGITCNNSCIYQYFCLINFLLVMLLNPSSGSGYEHGTNTSSGCWTGWYTETYAGRFHNNSCIYQYFCSINFHLVMFLNLHPNQAMSMAPTHQGGNSVPFPTSRYSNILLFWAEMNRLCLWMLKLSYVILYDFGINAPVMLILCLNQFALGLFSNYMWITTGVFMQEIWESAKMQGLVW